MAKKHDKIELTAEKRTITGAKVSRLRRDGLVPAVLYGKGMSAVSLQIPLVDFSKALKSAGESTLVYLKVGSDTFPTLIHDVYREPLTGSVNHADFYKVRLDEKIKTNVPVVFTGEAPAVKSLGGIFVRNVNELEVEALPQDLPHEVSIDVSRLENFGDQILLKDIKLGVNINVIGSPEEIIATVQEPMSEEELKASLEAPTTDVSSVEEIKKEKPAEEAAEEGEAAPAAVPEAK